MALTDTSFNAIYSALFSVRQPENAKLKYTINWHGAMDSSTISSSTWTTEDSGITISDQANTTTEASCKVTGDPGSYRIVNKVTLADGDIDERIIDVRIIDNTKPFSRTNDFGFMH